MPEPDFYELFEQFQAGPPLVIPAGPEAARRVHRRRHRTRVAAVSAAVAVVGAVPVVGYAVLGPGQPDIAATPSASTPNVEPTDIAASALLQEADLPGYALQGPGVGGDWSYSTVIAYCPDPPILPAATAEHTVIFSGPDGVIVQLVQRFTAVGAADYLDHIRWLVARCASSFEMRQSITQEGFAGDDSLIIEAAIGSTDNVFVFVRTGSLVSQVWYKDTTTPDPVAIGERAAARLCKATTAC